MKLGSARWGLTVALVLAACDSRVEGVETPASAGAGGTSAAGAAMAGTSAGPSGGGGSAGETSSSGTGATVTAGSTGSAGSAAGAAAVEACASGGFAWPHGAKAAVSLTYDDGLPSQLANATPSLESSGLVATLFLSESYGGFEARKSQYQALAARGFELAAHTVKHPCFGLTPDLKGYDQAALATELDQNIATLRALGMSGALTFAYPCGNTEYGEPAQTYVPLIEERFFAARGVNCCAQVPAAVDLYNVNTNWPAETATAADVTTPVDQAIAAGSWLVFGFHAVGAAPGEWSAVPQEAHDALVAHLVAKKSEIWVATFGAVADYVKRCR